MSYNVPSYNVDNITFGPAVVYIGPATAGTPSTDVGAIDPDEGVTLRITRSKQTIAQGNPKIPIFSFDDEVGVEVSFTVWELDFSQLAWALGGGVTTATSIGFGGKADFEEVAIKIEHYMAKAGKTITISIWRADGSGEVERPMGSDKHAMTFTFRALAASTDWAGTTLGAEEKLIKIERSS